MFFPQEHVSEVLARLDSSSSSGASSARPLLRAMGRLVEKVRY